MELKFFDKQKEEKRDLWRFLILFSLHWIKRHTEMRLQMTQKKEGLSSGASGFEEIYSPPQDKM